MANENEILHITRGELQERSRCNGCKHIKSGEYLCVDCQIGAYKRIREAERSRLLKLLTSDDTKREVMALVAVVDLQPIDRIADRILTKIKALAKNGAQRFSAAGTEGSGMSHGSASMAKRLFEEPHKGNNKKMIDYLRGKIDKQVKA